MKCQTFDCAHNDIGVCKLLSSRPRRAECPFYKTEEQMKEGYQKAYDRLSSKRMVELALKAAEFLDDDLPAEDIVF